MSRRTFALKLDSIQLGRILELLKDQIDVWTNTLSYAGGVPIDDQLGIKEHRDAAEAQKMIAYFQQLVDGIEEQVSQQGFPAQST